MITDIYFHVGSQMSPESTFHWVTYLPRLNHSTHNSNKFNNENNGAVLIPRWNGGGLQILHAKSDPISSAEIIVHYLKQAFGINPMMVPFILGLPMFP